MGTKIKNFKLPEGSEVLLPTREMLDFHVEMWNKRGNANGAKFGVGQKVSIFPKTPVAPGWEDYWAGVECEVRASNGQSNLAHGENDVEYIVTDYPLMLWEDELKEIT